MSSRFMILALSIGFYSASCSSTPSSPDKVYGSDAVARSLNALLKEPYSDTHSVEIYYVTNRAQVGKEAGCGDRNFGITVGEKVSYGLCQINVPKKHAVGSIEITRDPRADSNKFFRVLGHEELNEDLLKQTLKSKRPSDVLVFVHGFNVKFEEAVMRAAQITYDLKFQGPVVLFSWPAGAGSGVLDSALISRTYASNKQNAAASIGVATDFARLMGSLDMTTHWFIHSMGHQVIIPALATAGPMVNHKFIGELVLNAPDFPVEDFAQFAPPVKAVTERVTVYCSYNDNAIAASQIYNSNRRLGGCERFPGVDVVNVGEIDAPTLGVVGLGHGYYSSRPILADVFQVLLRIEPERRLFIRKAEPNSTEDYFLRP